MNIENAKSESPSAPSNQIPAGFVQKWELRFQLTITQRILQLSSNAIQQNEAMIMLFQTVTRDTIPCTDIFGVQQSLHSNIHHIHSPKWLAHWIDPQRHRYPPSMSMSNHTLNLQINCCILSHEPFPYSTERQRYGHHNITHCTRRLLH